MIYVTQKKLHAQKEEKLLKRFWDRLLPPPPPPSILTDGRTTDKSVLEKLRCLSAGGAKKGTILTFWPLKNNLYSDSTKSLLCKYVANVIPKKLHVKKRKSYGSVSEIGPSPLKVDADAADTDAADDDGRVAIWKAPLPDGTAELKRAKFDLSDLEKWPLERFKQTYLLICDLYHAKEAS